MQKNNFSQNFSNFLGNCEGWNPFLVMFQNCSYTNNRLHYKKFPRNLQIILIVENLWITTSEGHLEPGRTSTAERFCENSEWLKAVNYFC